MRNLFKKIVLSTLSVSCIASAVGGALSLDGALKTSANDAEENKSAAYFLGEDRSTQGLWYNGQHGTKGDPDADRNYGVDGCILFYHWLRVDGQPIKDVEILGDFSNDTNVYKNNERANYCEIPEYVESVTGDPSNGYLNYWINGNGTDIEKEWASTYPHMILLPVEGGYDTDGNLVHFGQGGFGTSSNGSANFYTVEVSDNEWHDVSLYVASSVFHKYTGYDEQTMTIYDLDDNVLAEYVVKDPAQGVYLKFAVKGSYKIKYQTNTYAGAGYQYGLFFDPHTENEEIGTSNLTASLEGAKIVNLSWENKSADSFTTIYRRLKGADKWEYLDSVEKGVASYRDTSTVISKTYEYALSSGTTKTTKAWHDQFTAAVKDTEHFNEAAVCVKYNNLPDEANKVECSTAPYKGTKLMFGETSYTAERESVLQVSAKLTKTDDNGETYVPYAGIEVTFTLDGDAVESDLGTLVYPNMNKTFGKGETDAEGVVTVEGSIPYGGDYDLIASIELQPDSDPMTGYDECSASVHVAVQDNITIKNVKPVITMMSDAIKPGDTATISGLNLYSDGALKIAYVKHSGADDAAEYSENGKYKYIDEKDILVADSENGTGITFVFPKDEAAGMYDFYVGNKNGWSKGYTMNAARPQYLDQEAAYEGQQIQIVGRNFLQSEYNAATQEKALENLRVKLTLVDENGNPMGYSKTLSQKNGGILTSLKETKETAMQFENDKLQAEDIPYTYELRITIKVPSVQQYGTYKVSVSSDGKYFCGLSEPCDLQIVEKKAQNWDETVFGTDKSSVVGNDPLNLGAYWAQDFNYTNVETMTPNTFETAKEFTKDLNNKLAALANQGGGVVYFPEGEYYLWDSVYMQEGVIIVGAGADKTTLNYSNNANGDTVWFRSQNYASNIGIARVKLVIGDDRCKGENGYYAPNFICNWGFTGDFGGDIGYSNSQNKFFVDIDMDGVMDNLESDTRCRQYILICANKNVIWRNCDLVGAQVYTRADRYVTFYNVYQIFNGKSSSSPPMHGRYTFIENCYIDQNLSGHGISIRSNTYCAYTYVAHAGNRVSRSNQGEAILAEAPSGQIETGKVLAADARSITLDAMGGKKLDKDTLLHYNRFAVYISDGTGAGQIRYIDRVGEGEYTNRYNLLDYEADWDVIPDETSVFYICASNSNITISHFKAYDTAGTICLYSNCWDTVVSDCTLVDTAGIGIWAIPVDGMRGGRIDMAAHIRIERNDISGVSAHYDVGSTNSQGVGGIFVSYSNAGEYAGMIINDILIRDNRLYDLMPEVSSVGNNGWINGSGITLYSGVTTGQGNPNAARNIVVENNVVEDSEYGIYVDRLANGVVIKNNTVKNTSLYPDNMQVFRPNNFVNEAYHELIVNGQVSSLSGNYSMGSALPDAPDAGDKVFFGWTADENYTADSVIVNSAYGVNSKLYAVYGYKVVFDYNYEKSDGTQKGEYVTLKTLAGGNVADALESYGDPFRVNDEFLGWYTDKACTQAFDASAAVNGNVTVYAKWSSAASNGGSTNEEGKKGCKGAVSVSAAVMTGVALIAACAVVVSKRKEL